MKASRNTPPTAEQVIKALDGVQDPEIHRPITELRMVKGIEIAPDGTVAVAVWLTVAGGPLRETITRDVTAAVGKLPGVSSVSLYLDVMSAEQRQALQSQLRGGRPEPQIPFAQPASLTRVYAVASGKGGVGKSSVTVNLAAALAASGHKVGAGDADIYGHSVPRMLGVTGRPTPVENMIMPPSAHDVKVISIGMFTKGNTPVVWRGPMLHRALQQFLADVYWGDLDVLLLDLPPGTGDVAISVAQMLPTAELLVVTTPQLAAAEVAERAGAVATQTHQRIAGVIENMSYLVCAHCGEQTEIFGSGGGASVAEALGRITGTQVPLLGQGPLDVRLREGGVGGTRAGGEQRAVGPGVSGWRVRGPGVAPVQVGEQVLLHEPLGVQILELEVGELRAQPVPQVVLGALGDPAQVTQGPPGLGGHLRQLLRAEDDERDHGQDENLADGQIKHAQVSVALVRSRTRMSTVNRVRSRRRRLVRYTGQAHGSAERVGPG